MKILFFLLILNVHALVSFSPGQQVSSEDINSNFTELDNKITNLGSGSSLDLSIADGNLYVDRKVSTFSGMDGYQISASPSNRVFRQDSAPIVLTEGNYMLTSYSSCSGDLNTDHMEYDILLFSWELVSGSFTILNNSNKYVFRKSKVDQVETGIVTQMYAHKTLYISIPQGSSTNLTLSVRVGFNDITSNGRFLCEFEGIARKI